MLTRVNLFIVLLEQICGRGPIVWTELGAYRGVTSAGVDMFLGIPFALVNKSNPFGAPLPTPSFEGVFEANDDFITCPHFEELTHTVVGDVDCLQLNIYRPSLNNSDTLRQTTNALPVLVWIAGSGFKSSYRRIMEGPTYLVRYNVIVVTVNHRIGPYGFMCLDIAEVPGNQGLKDTLAALRWVKAHIASFGGDPGAVTVGGNSSGGTTVDYHLLRNTNEVLFRNAIIESGTIMTPFYAKPDKKAAVKIAHHLGCETNETSEAIAFLATLPPNQIIKSVKALNIKTLPCVEKELEGVEAFVTNYTTVNEHRVINTSILTGFANDEGLELAQILGLTNQSAVDHVLSMVFDNFTDETTKAVTDFYFGNVNDTQRAATDLVSDFVFIYPVIRNIRKLLDSNVERLFLYMFSYVGGRNFVKYRDGLKGGGATHSDSIGYLFDTNFIRESPSEEDQMVIDKMTTMWTNFVKHGDPTPRTRPDALLDVQWPPVTHSSLPCMLIAPRLSLTPLQSPYRERVAFLDRLYSQYGHLQCTVH